MSEGQRLKYVELAPEAMAALSGVEHVLNTGSGVETVLLELVRLRASLMNGCAYCVGLHRHELQKHHEPLGRIDGVAEWRENKAYTQRERAALRWAEVITDIQDGHADEAEFTAVRRHFSDAEVVHLTVAVASINAWNRMAIAFRPVWRGSKPESVPKSDAGESVEVKA